MQRLRTVSGPLVGDRSTSAELKHIAEKLRVGGWLARIEAEHGRLPR